MAETEKIIFETEVKTGNSAASIKSVKSELRSLTNELAALEPGSAAFNKAAQRAGELKDKIEDAQMAVKAFNPEAKFQAFANVVGGVANGFAAAQGAMAIFGADSKELEQTMVKTQGAIALATGLNGLLGMKDQLIIMAGVIKTTVVSAFATMRAAIISTGIIGLVAIIGTLIYQWAQEKKATEEAAKELERFNEVSERIRKSQTENAAKALGKRQEERTKIQEIYNDEVKSLQKQLDEKKIKNDEFHTLIKEAFIKQEFALKQLEDGFRKEDLSKKKEYNAKVLEEKQKAADERLAIDNWEDEQIRQGNEQIEADRLKSIDKQIEDAEYFASVIKEIDDQTAKDKKTHAQTEIEIEKMKLDAKVASLEAYASILSSISDLMGQDTEKGKALAIASALISTYAAIAKTLGAFSSVPIPGYAIAQAVAIGIAGLASVKRIAETKVPGKGGSSASASMPNISSGASAPPIVRPTSSSVNINQGQPITTRQVGQSNQRVYVLESDITDSQKKVDSIRQKAIIK